MTVLATVRTDRPTWPTVRPWDGPSSGSVEAMRLHVGCAMWTHKAWQGRLLPHPLPPSERLRAYAGWCNAVEGNTTFYATPARDTVASWAQQTDPDFRFVVKLPKLDHPRAPAHRRRRASSAPSWTRSSRSAREPTPSGSSCRARSRPADVPAPWPASCAGCPPSHRYAVEVRHPAFFDDPRSARLLEGVLADRRRRVDPVRHHRVLPQPADQRRRTGRLDQEAAHAAAVARR